MGACHDDIDGLVHGVVEPGEFAEALDEFVTRLLAAAPLALTATEQAVNAATSVTSTAPSTGS